MKLSSAYLTKKLEKWDMVIRKKGITGEDEYLRPVFLCGTSPFGHVVILDTWEEEMAERLNGAAVFCIFLGAEPCAELKAPYICLPKAEKMEVFNLLTDIFDECEQWIIRLRSVMMSTGNIGRMLRISYEFIGNPLTVMGQDFTFVADAGNEDVAEEYHIFVEENVNADYMNEMIQYKTLQDDSAEPVIYPAFLGGCRTIGTNLQVGEQKTHRLILAEAKEPVGEAEFCLLKELLIYLEFALAHMPSILEKSGLEDVFLTALSDRMADYLQVSRKLNQLGWGAKQDYFCLVLQILYEEQSSMTTHGIRKYMKKQFPDSCSFEYDGYIVTFFNLSRLEMNDEEVEQKLTYFIRDSYLKAGYSRVVRGHMGIRRQFLQARIALEVGNRIKPYIWIYRFNQMVLPYMLEQTTKNLPGRMLCHEGILELMRLDEECHTQYIQTLRTYLNNQLNATKTANDLFIHRSTFLYRLDKIREILQSSLEDPEELFYLNYSLRLLEQE